MRALVIGFVGAIISASTANAAAGCLIDKATLEIRDTGFRYAEQPVLHPNLVGSTYRVKRYTSVVEMRYVASRDTTMNLGYEAYELTGRAGAFVIKRERAAGIPAIAATSWGLPKAGSGETRVAWGSGHPETVTPGQEVDYVLDGPLQSLALVVRSCT